MIERVKEILDILDVEGIVKKSDMFKLKNNIKTQKALRHITVKKYAFVFNAVLIKAPRDGATNLMNMNPRYKEDPFKYTEERLALIQPNYDTELVSDLSTIEWCYILYRDGYRKVTSQFVSNISKRNYLYVQRQMLCLEKCGYISLSGNSNNEFILKYFRPTFGTSILKQKIDNLNDSLKRVEKIVKPNNNPRKEEKRAMTDDEMSKIAIRLTKWMNPETKAESLKMTRIFKEAIKWGEKHR